MELQRLFVELALRASEFTRGLDGARRHAATWAQGIQRTVGNALRGMGRIALTALGAATTALAIFTAGGVTAAATMEEQMSAIAAVFGVAREEIAPLGALIQELGLNPNLKVTSEEAAAAIEMLARNGLTMTQILEGAAEATVLLANATGSDFSNAANIATDAMAIFDIKAADMIDAVNGIVSVTTNSKFTIDDYALALAQAGGVAAASGVPFDEFNATIAAISPLFASGSDAGTSFKTFLQRLIPASETAKDAMQELGLITEDGSNRFFDAQGNLRSMSEVAGILQEALGGLSEEQRNAALATIFGTDSMRAAVGMMRAGEDGMEALMEQMARTDAVQSAATRMDNLKGVLEILGGVVEAVQLSLGAALLPILRLVADTALRLADQALPAMEARIATLTAFVTTFATALRDGAAPLEALRTALATVLPPETLARFDALMLNLQALLAWAVSALAPIGAAIAQFVSWNDVLLVLGAAIVAAIIPALWGLLAPILAIVAPILAVIAVVAALRTAWETNFLNIQGVTAAVWEAIQIGVGAVIAALQPAFQAFIDSIRGGMFTVQPLLTAFKDLWQVIGPVVIFILSAIGAALLVLLGVATGVIRGVIAAVGPLVQTFVNLLTSVVTIFTGIADFIRNFFMSIYGLFTNNRDLVEESWAGMMEALVTITTALVDGIVDLVTGLWDTVVALVGGLVMGVIDFFTNLYQALVGGSIVPDLVNEIVGWIQALHDALLATVSAIRDFFVAIWTGIKDFLASTWQNIRAATNAAATAIQQRLSAFVGDVRALWTGFLNGLRTAWSTAWTAVQNLMGNSAGWLRNTIASLVTTLLQRISEFGQGLRQRWHDAWMAIATMLSGSIGWIWGKIGELISGIFGRFGAPDWGSIGTNIIRSIANAVAGAASFLADAVRSAAEAAYRAALAALGIGSPSKLFTWIGEMSVEGLIRPFEDTRPIEAAMGKLAGVMAQPLPSPALATPLGMRAGGGDQVTITIDARGATPAAATRIEAAVERALQRHGRRADTIERMR